MHYCKSTYCLLTPVTSPTRIAFNKTQQGKDKGCVCLEAVQNYIEEHYDKEFFDLQRNLFEQALKDLPDSAPPSCFRNSHGDNFEGNPKASPSDWCVCTSGISQGKYSTIAGKDPCALKTMPTQTITIKDLQPINTQDPTSCRLVEPKYVFMPIPTIVFGKI